MDVRLTYTDCDEAGDYVLPNVLSPRDIVSRPDNMDETVLHTGVTPQFTGDRRHIKQFCFLVADCLVVGDKPGQFSGFGREIPGR